MHKKYILCTPFKQMQTPDVSILTFGLQETVKMAYKLTFDFWNETPRFRDDDPQSSTNLEDISSFALL